MDWDIKIGDPLTSVTDFISIKVVDTIAGSKKFDAVFNDANGKLGLYNQYDDVQILLDSTIIFRGRIELMLPDFDTNTIEISGKDYLGELLDRYIIESYTDKKRSYMVNDLVQKYAPSLTRNNIVASLDGTEMTRVFKTTAWSAVVECAEGEDCRFWVDNTKDFHYGPSGYINSDITITLGADPILGFDIIESGEEIVNRVTVYGTIIDDSQIVTMVEDIASQTEYGLIKEHRIVDATIDTTEVATAKAQEYLDKHAWKLDIINLNTIGYETLNASEMIHLTLGRYSINDDYLVITKTHEYPSCITKIQVARYAKNLEGLIADLIERLLILEKQYIGEDAITTKINRFYEGMKLVDTFKIERWAVLDSALFGVSGHCEFGTINWGDRRTYYDEVTG